MNNKQSNQFIGFVILAVIAYHVLQATMPFLIWAVIAMVAARVIQEFNKHK